MTNGSTRNRLKQKVKSHIPKDWLTEIRITARIIAETFKGINQSGFLINIAIIGTMAAIFRTTLSLSSIVEEMGGALELSVYLEPQADVNSTIKNVKKLKCVKNVSFVSKEKSWNDMKREINMPDVENPLPDVLRVCKRACAKGGDVEQNKPHGDFGCYGCGIFAYNYDYKQHYPACNSIKERRNRNYAPYGGEQLVYQMPACTAGGHIRFCGRFNCGNSYQYRAGVFAKNA